MSDGLRKDREEQTSEIVLERISDDTKYQIMPDLSSEEYDRLKTKIKREGFDPTSPILIYYGRGDEERRIIDGFNRVRIANELDGIERVPYKKVEVESDDPEEIEEELYERAYEENTHRRQLSHGQKTKLAKKEIDRLIEKGRHKSDTAIANLLAMSTETVRNAREDLWEKDKWENPISWKFAPQEAKKERTKEYIRKHPEESNNAIAEADEVPVSRKSVQKYRKEVEAEDALESVLNADLPEGWKVSDEWRIEDESVIAVLSHDDRDHNQTIRYEVENEMFVFPTEGDRREANTEDEAVEILKELLDEKESETKEPQQEEEESEATTSGAQTTTTVGDDGTFSISAGEDLAGKTVRVTYEIVEE